MDEILLEAQLRTESGRAGVKDLKEQGFIPAVVYSSGKESVSLKLPRRQFLRLMHEHHLESAVVNLKVADEKKSVSRPCLVKEIQHDPVHGEVIHVDFNEISLTKAIKVKVPIVAKGEPVGVKQEGGSLEHILWELEVECLPTSIPKEIALEVGALKLGEAIHVKDIAAPAGVKILDDPSAIVLSIAEPMKEEVAAAPVEGEEMQEPEVIKEKKEVPEEGEAPDKEAKKEPKKEEKK